MSETYYKVLRRHEDGTLRSAHGGSTVWPEPKRIGFALYEPGAPVMAHATPRICAAGVHLTTDPLQWLTVMPAECYLAEPVGPVRGRRDDKVVFDGARLIEPVEVPWWWREVEAFVASIPATPWMQRVAPPLPEWRVFATWASARDSAWASARDSAGASARDSARDSAWARASAWDSAGDSAGASAWDSAGDSAWARASAWDSAGDSALLAQCLCCGGLPLDPKHLAHARARWEVWQRGYGLLCDVDGGLYVYEAIS